MKHINITVKGKVQRIGFRFIAMQTAVRLGISGTIMNLDSDKVFIEAEGEDDEIDNFIAWCQHGPPWAKVQQVTIEQSEIKNYTSFEILDRK